MCIYLQNIQPKEKKKKELKEYNRTKETRVRREILFKLNYLSTYIMLELILSKEHQNMYKSAKSTI